eukprot:scaffold79347_cov17-Prasinocladus_malaysianus.AAC.1
MIAGQGNELRMIMPTIMDGYFRMFLSDMANNHIGCLRSQMLACGFIVDSKHRCTLHIDIDSPIAHRLHIDCTSIYLHIDSHRLHIDRHRFIHHTSIVVLVYLRRGELPLCVLDEYRTPPQLCKLEVEHGCGQSCIMEEV